MLIGQAAVQRLTELGLQNCWGRNEKVSQSASLGISDSSVNCAFVMQHLCCFSIVSLILQTFSEVYRIYLQKT